MEFVVRRAVIGEEGVLRRLRMQALTDSPSAFSTTLEREMARTTEDWQKWMNPSVTFLVEAGGEARGLVSGSRDPEDGSVVLLRAMWVHPEMRGTGAAAALVEAVKGWEGKLERSRCGWTWWRRICGRGDVMNARDFARRDATAWWKRAEM